MSVQVQRATDPTISAWVSANAGAGKTYLLTDRVTRLLLSGAHPARILCLTYTKAAAAEMQSRLFARLGEWALLADAALHKQLAKISAGPTSGDDLCRARRLFAQALETPGGLKIQTIHSFCQHLLARFPVEAGIPPRFNVLDERSAAELLDLARHRVLERASEGDKRLAKAVATLATRAADARFAEILDLAVAEADKLRDVLARHDGEEAQLFARLRAKLEIEEDETESSIVARFCDELAAERDQCERVAKWLSNGLRGDKSLARSMSQFLDGGMAPDSIDFLRELFMTQSGQSGPRKNLATKDVIRKDLKLHEYLVDLQRRFVAMEDARKRAMTAALSEALVTVTIEVVAVYEKLKRERAALDYDDLITCSLALLEQADAASWVLYKLDGGLDHILVDEAQDTSPQQWKIIAKLTEEFFSGRGARDHERPRTVFAVGDEKQSIFSFQGADPEAFGKNLTAFRRRVEGAGLVFAAERPTISRRSGKSVLEFVDELFANSAARDGLTSTDDPVHHDPNRSEDGRVEFWPSVEAPENPAPDPWEQPVDAPHRDSAGSRLARRIADRIARWLKEGTAIPGTEQAIRPGDIMILVRRRNVFAQEMIRQLLERGVPVAGADRMVLKQQIAILDLVALGRFALLPDDDLNLAALLKSPLIGLSEDELYALAQPRQGPLWRELVARKDERPSFASAHAFLKDTLARADFVPPFEFYAHVLGAGMRKKLVARLGDEAADAIDEFLALALMHEGSHPPSLESFLAWFEKGASEVKRDMEHAGSSVRVMTVHGAKGLEAPIVILPDTAQVPDYNRRTGFLYTDDCVFFGVRKDEDTPPVAAAKAQARLSEMREYRRLLYVAATRAREWLIVEGYETQRGVERDAWYEHLRVAARKIGREELIDGEQVAVLGAELSTASGAPVAQVEKAVSLPGFLTWPTPQEPARPRRLRPSEAAGLDEFPVVSPLGDSGKRFRRGLLIHALLARLPEVPNAARADFALRYLVQRGVETDEAKRVAEETLAVLEHPDFADLFGGKGRAEVAITATLPELGDGITVSGQIDRLAVLDDRVLVADFKTNRPPPKTVEETPELYVAQMALYRAALQKIYPGKRVDCALVWTDGARLMALPAALLDESLANVARREEMQDLPPFSAP
jgi:ATP-dependent helicase/nuclease subunit A